MRSINSKILQEDKFYDIKINQDERLTIEITNYIPTNNIDPYIKVYKYKRDFSIREMCRLSILEPKYIGMPDETLNLHDSDFDHLYNLIDTYGWYNILYRLSALIYDENSLEDIDNSAEKKLELGYKINDYIIHNIIMPDYKEKLNDSPAYGIILQNRNKYNDDKVLIAKWLKDEYKSDIIYEDDELIIKADCSSNVPLARIYNIRDTSKYYTINLITRESVANKYYSLDEANASSFLRYAYTFLSSDPKDEIKDRLTDTTSFFDVDDIIQLLYEFREED